MGCQQSTNGGLGAEEEARTDKRINQEQYKALREDMNTVKLMCVGSGDSGKSTLMKQLSNLHTPKFKDATYRQTFATTIYRNLYDGAFALAASSPSLISPDELAQLEASSATNTLPLASALIITRLFRSTSSDLSSSSSGQQLQDCFKYYAKKLCDALPADTTVSSPIFTQHVFCGPGFVPSTDDCVRSRVRTSGILTYEFEDEGIRFSFADVGGQRAERRKWLDKFDNMEAIIFVCAASEYDLNLFEDPKKNRLEDSLELFEQVVSNKHLRRTPVLLYLNKKDLLEAKLRTVPLNVSGRFPSAPTGAGGRPVDVQEAIKWLSSEFEKRCGGSGRQWNDGQLLVHATCATDPDNVSKVFAASRATILKQNLVSSRFM